MKVVKGEVVEEEAAAAAADSGVVPEGEELAAEVSDPMVRIDQVAAAAVVL